MRKAISVTLTQENLLWLKALAGTTSKRSVSEVLDTVITEARLQGRVRPEAIRSVAGTIDLPEDESALEAAEAQVRTLFDRSLRRPMLVREAPPRKGGGRRG